MKKAVSKKSPAKIPGIVKGSVVVRKHEYYKGIKGIVLELTTSSYNKNNKAAKVEWQASTGTRCSEKRTTVVKLSSIKLAE